MPGGAPLGNKNSAKGRMWADAIRRAIARAGEGNLDNGMNMLADKVVIEALNGERWAIEEIGNRLDGKPAQAVTVGGDEENPLQVFIGRVSLVKPTDAGN